MRFLFTLFVLGVIPFGSLLEDTLDGSDEEIVKYVTNNGYPIETHQVETEDGYILTIFRIPHGRITNKTNKTPILLHHGMMGSAENFIWLGPEKSLGYLLADNGYDVWMMNARGTWHSKNHRTLKSDQKQFWNFSWHEIGVYDIPAVIDYILSITNKNSLYYVGHSQGTTSLFVMGSERPEYNDKIKVMIALAPAAYYRYVRNPLLKMAAANYDLLKNLAGSLPLYEFPPPFLSDDAIRKILTIMCAKSSAFKNTCTVLYILTSQVNPDTVDKNALKSMYPVILGSISIKQAFHYAQLIRSGNFQQYDYGPETNMKKYGSRNPPLYNLKNVTFPVALFFSESDQLISPEDVVLLGKELPNVAVQYKVPSRYFTHLDFILASNVKTLLYNKVLNILRTYDNK